ncbi:BCCT family transporter [Saccharothrix xinjiangensis]|uniref:BCCT family transporter n=1 Tax=Saccharothrix xinjiangensis TaxID=204798 RepID=UPI003A975384
MGTLSQRGSIRPAKAVVVFWGVLTGAVAAVMLLVGGSSGLTGLQDLTIIAALPFLVVMIGLCASLARDLRSDPLIRREERVAEVIEEVLQPQDPEEKALRLVERLIRRGV